MIVLAGVTSVKRVTVVMPVDMHKELKLLCINGDTTMQAQILLAVEQYLSKSGYEKNACK